MPYFSIIIPVYNVEPYLRECLDSVLAQTFTDWEAICIDDGSTDGSGAILDEYAAKDKRFRVFHQPNAGLSAARNKALENVRGEYFCFLDSDDIVDSKWLECFYKGFTTTKADMVRISWTPFYEQQPSGMDLKIGEYTIYSWDAQKEIEGYLSDLVKHCYVCICSYRSKKFVDERFSQNRICIEDVPYTLNLIGKCSCIAQNNYGGYYYRQRQGSLLRQTPDYDLWIAHLEEMRKCVSACKNPIMLKFYTLEIFGNLSSCITYGTKEQQKEVVSILKQLKKMRILDVSKMKFHFKCVALIFIVTGMIWPIKVLRYLIDARVRNQSRKSL